MPSKSIEEMKGIGKVSQDEHAIKVLVTRQDLTSDHRWAQNYEPGDVLRYTKVQFTDEKENLITVARENGELITYDPRRVQGVTAYRESDRSFAEGDRIQFTTAFIPKESQIESWAQLKKLTRWAI